MPVQMDMHIRKRRRRDKKQRQEQKLISDEIKKMLRLAPDYEAGSSGIQLADILSAYRKFHYYKNGHPEPVNTHQFQLHVISAAQENRFT